MNLEAKISLIQKSEVQLPPKDFLIFHPPNPGSLFTDDEIPELITPILYQSIPSELSTVQKSQWVKFQIIELLGYRKPAGLRTTQAKRSKPKFIHQLLDIFVQSRRNLQVWNYVPYADIVIPGEWNEESRYPYRYQDCRYLLVFHNSEGVILKITLVTGNELSGWDTTGTQTIKWQASARRSYRNEISSRIVTSSVEPLQSKFTEYIQQPLEGKHESLLQEYQDPIERKRRLYCHRKFRPLSKPRLCYNGNLLERSYPMAKRRRFTPQFKAEVVIEALTGQGSQAELCRKHNISQDQLSKWKHQLIDNAATLFESNDKHSNDSKQQIAQLEQLVGRLTIALDIQKKASTWLN